MDGIESGELKYRDILRSCDERIARHRMWVKDSLSNLEPERSFKTLVIWLYGHTGYGKSGIAEAIGKKLGDIYHKRTPKCWNRYDAHETVIWNEFCGSQVSYRELLEIMDRYPYEIETKGGTRQFLARTLVITSRKHPTECYDSNIVDEEQMMPRIEYCKELTVKIHPDQFTEVACNIISATSTCSGVSQD